MADKFHMRPRNDWVLVQETKVKYKDLEMPDQSVEGKEFRVISMGPDVTDLKVGEEVLMGGDVNKDVFPVPRQQGLWLVKQECVVLVHDSGREGKGP